MATKTYTLTKWTEQEIDSAMANKGTPGYSESYYSNKRSYTTEDGKEAWAVDVKEYYG
jgi:hypothetical protein